MLAGDWAGPRRAGRSRLPAVGRVLARVRPRRGAARQALVILDGLGAPARRKRSCARDATTGCRCRGGRTGPTGRTSAQLTARELDVLRLVALGLSNHEVAERLVLSTKTVAHHVSAVLRKLGEPTRARAVEVARRAGLLDQP